MLLKKEHFSSANYNYLFLFLEKKDIIRLYYKESYILNENKILLAFVEKTE